jgi:hypothetical protein
MKAYKFLLPGAVGPFSGFAWPAPHGGLPGAWVEAGGDAVLCRSAIHACRLEHLPWWIQDELWEAELAEPVQQSGHKLMSVRGRLVRRVDGWDAAATRAFARACAFRAAAHAVGVLERCDAPEAAAALRSCADLEALLSTARGLKVPEAARISVTMAGDGATRALMGHASTCAYIGAHAARQADGTAAMGTERAWQAAWLAERLALAT